MKKKDKHKDRWKLVLKIPASLDGYFPERDSLSGKEMYGKHGDHSSAWAVKFDHIPYSKFKVESVDKVYRFEFNRENLI